MTCALECGASHLLKRISFFRKPKIQTNHISITYWAKCLTIIQTTGFTFKMNPVVILNQKDQNMIINVHQMMSPPPLPIYSVVNSRKLVIQLGSERKWMLFLLCFHTEHFVFSHTATLNTAPLKGASNPFTDTQKHEEHISLAAIQPGLRWLTRCIRSGGHWAAGADVVSSDCGRNPEYLDRTHSDTGGGGGASSAQKSPTGRATARCEATALTTALTFYT